METSSGPKLVAQTGEFEQKRRAIYKPLSKTQQEIRVLHLLPGSWDDPVHAKLVAVALHEQPEFEALSYVWGDVEKTYPIFLDGLEYEITLSQITALTRLRRPDAVRRLWIDAICIDQANVDERNSQVSFMGTIYKAASGVAIWLGELCRACSEPDVIEDNFWLRFVSATEPDVRSCLATEHLEADEVRCSLGKRISRHVCNVTKAMEVAKLISEDRHFYNLPLYRSSSEGHFELNKEWFEALWWLNNLISQEWWTRGWCLQEAILPTSWPIIYAGPHELSLGILIDAVMYGLAHLSTESCCWKYALSLSSLECWNNVKFVFDIKASYDSGTIDFRKTFDHTRYRTASDSRDQVYALFGLLPAPAFPVDYQLSAAEVFAKASRHIIEHDRDLSSLEDEPRPVLSVDKDLPSWAIDFSGHRGHGNVSYEIWLRRSKLYHSSGELDHKPTLDCDDDRVLTITGHRLCAVSEIGPVCEINHFESYPVKLLRWELSCNQIAGVGEEAEPLRSSTSVTRDQILRSIFQNAWKASKMEKDGLEVARLWMDRGSRDKTADHEESSPRTDEIDYGGQSFSIFDSWIGELNVELASAWPDTDFVIFLTDDNKVGTVKPAVQEGDEIFLVRGSRKPLILRKVSKESLPSRKRQKVCHDSNRTQSSLFAIAEDGDSRHLYHFAGVCYLDGVMYGEALTNNMTWINIALV